MFAMLLRDAAPVWISRASEEQKVLNRMCKSVNSHIDYRKFDLKGQIWVLCRVVASQARRCLAGWWTCSRTMYCTYCTKWSALQSGCRVQVSDSATEYTQGRSQAFGSRRLQTLFTAICATRLNVAALVPKCPRQADRRSWMERLTKPPQDPGTQLRHSWVRQHDVASSLRRSIEEPEDNKKVMPSNRPGQLKPSPRTRVCEGLCSICRQTGRVQMEEAQRRARRWLRNSRGCAAF